MSASLQNKSVRRIRAAFLELLEEKGFYQVRVGDILARADVSRATFYTYYEDKYQLIRELREELLSGLGEIMEQFRQEGRAGILAGDKSDRNAVNPIFVEYFRYVQKNERLWRIFITGKGEVNFTDILSRYIYDHILVTQNLWTGEKDPEIPSEHSALLCSWAYAGLFSYWITTDMKETPEEMAMTLTVFWRRFLNWPSDSIEK